MKLLKRTLLLLAGVTYLLILPFVEDGIMWLVERVGEWVEETEDL